MAVISPTISFIRPVIAVTVLMVTEPTPAAGSGRPSGFPR
jgi:hypothetical protein